jgi:hypothetical protein
MERSKINNSVRYLRELSKKKIEFEGVKAPYKKRNDSEIINTFGDYEDVYVDAGIVSCIPDYNHYNTLVGEIGGAMESFGAKAELSILVSWDADIDARDIVVLPNPKNDFLDTENVVEWLVLRVDIKQVERLYSKKLFCIPYKKDENFRVPDENEPVNEQVIEPNNELGIGGI